MRLKSSEITSGCLSPDSHVRTVTRFELSDSFQCRGTSIRGDQGGSPPHVRSGPQAGPGTRGPAPQIEQVLQQESHHAACSCPRVLNLGGTQRGDGES